MKASTSKKEQQMYEDRRGALKWCLVSCFGYLGYRNAKFGRIEAHEATTAWGCEHLLRAKEIAEDAGFNVLHALTDSLWLHKENLKEDEANKLCDDISAATNINMSLEGIYQWMVFLPSKVNPKRPVPVRFFGAFNDGELKLRGLACRKSDTPPFIKEMQAELLEKLAAAKSVSECRAIRNELISIVQHRVDQLRNGDVAIGDLMIRRTLTMDLDSYSVVTRQARAAQKAREQGVTIHPGQKVEYLLHRADNESQPSLLTGDDALPDYNVGEYLKLLLKAAGEILDLLCDMNIEQIIRSRPSSYQHSSGA